jgi:hypothetical protein
MMMLIFIKKKNKSKIITILEVRLIVNKSVNKTVEKIV